RFVVFRTAVKRAELAVGDADVRVVDVTVDDVADDVRRCFLETQRMRTCTQLEQRRVLEYIEPARNLRSMRPRPNRLRLVRRTRRCRPVPHRSGGSRLCAPRRNRRKNRQTNHRTLAKSVLALALEKALPFPDLVVERV